MGIYQWQLNSKVFIFVLKSWGEKWYVYPSLHYAWEIIIPLPLLLRLYMKLTKTNLTRISTHIWTTFLTRSRLQTVYATRKRAICFIFVYISAITLFELEGFFIVEAEWIGIYKLLVIFLSFLSSRNHDVSRFCGLHLNK